MESFTVDTAKLELLDQMLVELDQSFGGAPAGLKEGAEEASSALQSLRNRLKCEMTQKVAQQVKDGDLEGALKSMHQLFPELKTDHVINILKLLYIDANNLARVILFVEKIVAVEFRLEVLEALYEEIKFKGHTQVPEMLLLQKSLRGIPAGEEESSSNEVLKQIDEDCLKIVDKMVDGVRAKDYLLSSTVIKTLGSSVLEEKMDCIVEKVHAAGTLLDTLLLIKFSLKLPSISNSCCCIEALVKVLEAKKLLQTEHALHLWAHVKGVMGYSNFQYVDRTVQKKCSDTCDKLDKNKKVYYEMYQSHLQNAKGKEIKALHKDNWQLQCIVSEFIDFYYDGELEKAEFLLSAAKNISSYTSRFYILNSLYEKMVHFDQLSTFAAFEVFTLVKYNLKSSSSGPARASTKSSKHKFDELRTKAPLCLQLLLWPNTSESAEFRLVNKFLNAPLFCTNMKVFCGPAAATRKDAQLWSAQVNTSTCLTTFSIQQKRQCFKALSATPHDVALAKNGTEWKVKVIDDHHIKLYSARDELLTVDLSSCQDAKVGSVCLRKENSTSLQLWRVEALNLK